MNALNYSGGGGGVYVTDGNGNISVSTTVAFLGKAQTFTAENTFNYSSSSAPSVLINPAITVGASNLWDGLLLANANTSVVRTSPANSPMIHFRGNAFSSNTSAAQNHDYYFVVTPIGSTTATTTSYLEVLYAFNGGSSSTGFTYSGQTGIMNLVGGSSPGITGIGTLTLGGAASSGYLVLNDYADGTTLTINSVQSSASGALTMTVNGTYTLTLNGSATISGVSITGSGTIATGTSTITLTGNTTLNQNLRTTDSPTFAAITISSSGLITAGTNGVYFPNGAINSVLSVRTDATDAYNSVLAFANQNGNLGANAILTLNYTGVYTMTITGNTTLNQDVSTSGSPTFVNISQTSDIRYKNIVSAYNRGLSEIIKLSPTNFTWNSLSGFDSSVVNTGFIAQEVLGVIPEAVFKDGKGFYSISDRPIIAALVNSIKELNQEIVALKSKLTNV